jgi:protein-S-isoprenylcysteine O-methyltransferase Ste14
MSTTSDKAGVIIFPPLLFGLGLAALLLLHWLWPLPLNHVEIRLVIGIALIVLAASNAIWGAFTLKRAGTHVAPSLPTITIVSNGPFRYSRNPLYVSLITLFLGISILIGSWWGLILLLQLLPILHFGIILREEKYLERKFGGTYLDYKHKVRRYL